LMAFGAKGYAELAVNLAYSIKKHSDIHITLAVQPDLMRYIYADDYGHFDKIVDLKPDDYLNNGKVDPARCKVRVYDIGSKYYKSFIYLDVDALCWQDINGLFDQCADTDQFYITELKGKADHDQVVNYSIWATNDDIVDFFGLKKKDQICAIQSSWCYFRVCDDAKKFMAEVKKYYKKGFPISKLTEKWGGTLPDELIFSGVISKMGIDCGHHFYPKPIHFGNEHPQTTFEQLAEDSYLLSVYGNGAGQTLTKTSYLEYYDRIMIKWLRGDLQNHKYKIGQAIKDKHANKH